MKGDSSFRFLNKNCIFKRSVLASCIMAIVSPAFSQNEGAQNEVAKKEVLEEELLVTGVRANIADAMSLKKNAATMVDAVSAKDIGALPDASVLEAVQRVPGVSIERFNAADDPDHFSVEGSGLTLRGLPQTRSEFNGRDSFSANNGRGLTFQDVSPELMGSVEIFKNQTADMVEGGISGTVNLNTRKPFDSDERILSFRAAANHSDFADETTPSYSGVYADSWDTSAGSFGLLLSHANAEFNFRTDGVTVGLWNNRDIDDLGVRLTPENIGIRRSEINRERDGSSIVFQYSDPSDRVVVTTEYFRQKGVADWKEAALNADGVHVLNDDAEFNGSAFVSGTLTGNYGPQIRRQNTDSKVEDFSLNVEWEATDDLMLEFDAQYVDASTNVLDLSIFTFTTTPINSMVDFSGAVPDVVFSQADNSAFVMDLESQFIRAGMDHIEESEGEEKAFAIDATYDFDHSILDSVMFGVRRANREQTTRWTNFNWQVLSEQWNWDGGGDEWIPGTTVFLNGYQDTTPYNGSFVVDPDRAPVALGAPGVASFDDFFRGRAGGGIEGNQLLIAPDHVVDNYDAFLAWTGLLPGGGGNGFAALPTRGSDDDPIVDRYYLPPEVNPVTEDNTAAYVRINFSDPSDKLTGNFGLRWVKQEVTTAGGITYPTPYEADDLIGFLDAIDPGIVPFANGGVDNRDATSDFSTVLPSLNLRYELAEDMFLRFGASQAIGYPSIGLYRYSVPISGSIETTEGGLTDPDTGEPIIDPDTGEQEVGLIDVDWDGWSANVGNPEIKPMEADNFDLSYEWYFDDASQFAVGVFYKSIEGFFTTAGDLREFTNNGVTQDVNTYGPVNSESGKLRGLEIAYSQFWENGLGVQANYTYLKSSNVPNQNTRPVQIDGPDGATALAYDNLPLQGLSEDTINLTGIYEKGPLSARIAVNYRSEYLLTQNEVNLGVPIFSQATTYVDASVFYDIGDYFQVGVTANNLTDEVVETSAQMNEQGDKYSRGYFLNDRRYAFVVVGKF